MIRAASPLPFLALAVLVAVLTAVLAPPPAAAASPPPRRAVGPLILEGTADQEGVLDELAASAERFLPRLERNLGVRLERPVRVVLLPPGGSEDPALARLDAAAPAWAAGFFLAGPRVAAVRLRQAGTYPYGDASGVLAHEIVHVMLEDAAPGRLPRWFDEGVATFEERRWDWRSALTHQGALLVGPLPSLGAIDRAFRTPSAARARRAYAASFDFVDWAVGEYGEDTVARVLGHLAASRDATFEEAWRAATGVPIYLSEEAWRSPRVAFYRWLPAVTSAGTLWLLMTLFFFVAVWRRRARTREIEERWEAEEGAGPSPPPKDDGGGWVN